MVTFTTRPHVDGCDKYKNGKTRYNGTSMGKDRGAKMQIRFAMSD